MSGTITGRIAASTSRPRREPRTVLRSAIGASRTPRQRTGRLRLIEWRATLNACDPVLSSSSRSPLVMNSPDWGQPAPALRALPRPRTQPRGRLDLVRCCRRPVAAAIAGHVETVRWAQRAPAVFQAPDGRQKEIWGYNGQLTGPLIRAKEGDSADQGRQRPGVPHLGALARDPSARNGQMDGVEDVSRPPIPPGLSLSMSFAGAGRNALVPLARRPSVRQWIVRSSRRRRAHSDRFLRSRGSLAHQ